MNGQPPVACAVGVFPCTRWSLVLAATGRQESGESSDALESICRAYWPPLYYFVRLSGHSPHDAQDLTQGFFAMLLERRWLETADPRRGRLRSFLVCAMKHYMAKEWRKWNAERRGGGRCVLPLDTEIAENYYTASANPSRSADQAYHEEWALTLLRLALDRLRAEFEAADKSAEFEVLKPVLMSARGGIDYAKVAGQLGGNETAARVAVHRFRKRYRAVFREEVGQTLSEGADLEAEIQLLAEALAGMP